MAVAVAVVFSSAAAITTLDTVHSLQCARDRFEANGVSRMVDRALFCRGS